MKTTLLIFFLATGIPAGVQMEQRWELEQRASKAARTLRNIYVVTPQQRLSIVAVTACHDRSNLKYVADDARSQPIIRFAVVQKDSEESSTTWIQKTSRRTARKPALI